MSASKLGLLLAALAAPTLGWAAPGDLDPTWGGTGTVTTALTAGSDTAFGMVLQPDGKVVTAGVVANANQDFVLVRYDANGVPDPAFGTGGVVATNFGNGTQNDVGRAIVRQPDGKLVVAGNARGPSNTNDFGLARYDAAGSLDAVFGTGGKVTTAIGTGNEVANAVTLQPDGKIVAAGNAIIAGNVDVAVVRYQANGSLDATFGTGGIVTTPIGTATDSANAVAVQADGKIVVAGYGTTGTVLDLAVVRYNADGSLDAGFGTGGKAIVAIGPGYALAQALVIQPDGSIVAAGYTTNGTDYDFAVVRLLGDGSLDPAFGTGGKVTTPIGPANDQARALVREPDGKLVVGGYAWNGTDFDLALVKYAADGSLDTSFGTGGIVTTAVSGDDGANGLALQADGRLVAAGFTGPTATPNFLTARYANVVCGNGTPEAGEACDAGASNGTAGSCCSLTCGFVAAGTTCRAAAGACDVAETCTGASGACPADSVSGAFVTCRAAAGPCDVAETCDGVGTTCPVDGFAAVGTVCRAVGGACDVAETCSGASAACPADGFVAVGTVCRAAGGVCDLAETCSGASAACPADGFVTAGTVCRAAGGVCDVAETCSGASAACPADGFAAVGTVCRAAAGACDLAETCSGTSAACPADAFRPASTVCRPASGACDVAESCTGLGATCPADTGLPDGDADGVCDAADNCAAVPNPGQENGDADALGDACDACTNAVPTVAEKPLLLVTKLLAPAGDEGFVFKTFLDDVPASPTVSPVANGLRILVTDSTGATPIDVTLPPGAFDTSTKTGWLVNGAGTSWTYKGPGTATNGVQKALVRAMPSTLGMYLVKVKGKNSTYPVNPSNLPLVGTVVIDTPIAAGGQCGEATFPATAPTRPSCTALASGKTVKCK